MTTAPLYSFVVPLYNEQENFQELTSRLEALAAQMDAEILLIDDGSRDNTRMLMYDKALTNDKYQCVFLSRNHGHQLALSAGLQHARGTKAIMIVDGDLQDPPELIKDFIPLLDEGYDVIYGVRKKRKEGPLKRFAYWLYYRIITGIAAIDMPLDSGDFALVSRRVINLMNMMPERNRYLRGMRTWVGFKQKGVEYERKGRHAGETKYTMNKLMELALSGLYNFSDLPVKLMMYLGAFALGSSIVYLFTVLYKKIMHQNVPSGFTATIIILVFLSGIQMIGLGIIGGYVLRIYKEAQNRPLFVIDKIIKDQKLDEAE